MHTVPATSIESLIENGTPAERTESGALGTLLVHAVGSFSRRFRQHLDHGIQARIHLFDALQVRIY